MRKAPTPSGINQFNIEAPATIENAETTTTKIPAKIMIKAMTLRPFKASRRKRSVERFKVPSASNEIH